MAEFFSLMPSTVHHNFGELSYLWGNEVSLTEIQLLTGSKTLLHLKG